VWSGINSGFLVDVGGNLILVDPSGFFRFWFRV